MIHIEPIEPRHLCAAGPDPTFGKHGGVPFVTGDYIVDSILATHGSVFVSATDRNRRREVVFKFDDNGRADTAWGNGGYIVPRVFARPVADLSPKLEMSYDSRTKGLVVGFGDFDRVILERRDAAGAVDTTWGTAGHFSYREPKRYFTLKSVVTLAGKKVLLTARRQGLDRVYDQVIRPDEDPVGHFLQPIPGGGDDVVLIRLDRLGRRDHAFNSGRTLTVAGGSLTYRNPKRDEASGSVLAGTEYRDEPTFGELQFRADGSVRVVSTRITATTVISQINLGTPSADRIEKRRGTVFAESTVVSADGKIVPEKSQSYVLKRYSTTVGGYDSHTSYEPVAAYATGDDGIAVLANSPGGSSLLHVSPGKRSTPINLFPPTLEFEYSTLFIDVAKRGVNGDVLVRANAGTTLRLTSDLTTQTELDNAPVSYPFAFDDTGRLLTVYGDEVSRFV